MDWIIEQYNDIKIIISGNFNAKRELWGKSKLDTRGQELIDFIKKSNLDILNNPYSLPTYS